LLVACVGVAGCGGTSTRSATLVLDFTPNAVHAGIYAALANRYDAAAGVRLHVVAPTASTDSIKLLETGRATFAILDIHDLAIARERGADVVGVMAVVERPLAAVIAQPQVTTPRKLEGRTVGVTGVPSDTAVLASIVSGAGGNPRRVRLVTIGFNAVPDLLAGRVAAATAFWNDEGVALSRRAAVHVFRVDAYGAPPYPELVLCATRATLVHRPGLARAAVRALVRGYGFAINHPAAAAADLESQVQGLDPQLVEAQLRALQFAFESTVTFRPGTLDPSVLATWGRWEARFRIVSRPPNIQAMFDRSFVTSSGP
jgi:NitT/TauT family transport system substrate-binding protein/putative hydroxymethylpyrimidine transport system substrate-binding protein